MLYELRTHHAMPGRLADMNRREAPVMPRSRARVALAGLLAIAALGIACDKSPAQKAGEKVDRALDTDKAIGKGPMEKAGKEIDKAADSVKK